MLGAEIGKKPLIEKWKEKGISEEIAGEEDENDTVEAVCFLGYEVDSDLKELFTNKIRQISEEVSRLEIEYKNTPSVLEYDTNHSELLNQINLLREMQEAIFGSKVKKVIE